MSADVQRPDSVPPVGVVEPFDAGWDARALGFARRTVEVLSADPGWALLGYDTRALIISRAAACPPPEEEK